VPVTVPVFAKMSVFCRVKKMCGKFELGIAVLVTELFPSVSLLKLGREFLLAVTPKTPTPSVVVELIYLNVNVS
jgi:hypothetical protein